MTNYKYYYFPHRGIGEPARMVMHYAKVQFEDIRVPYDEWPGKHEKKMPQGTMPVLVIDGTKKLSQSTTISLYLARKYGLAGKNEWEMARVEESVATTMDFYNAMAQYSYVVAGFKEGDKDKLYETVAVPACDRYLPIAVKMLKLHKNTFIASQKPTVADFFLAEFLHSFNNFDKRLFKDYQDLLKYVERVREIPELQSYYKVRPTTMF